jgi:hypothetical protein
MDRVTVERVARVQAHILEATLSTSENSTLSGPEQDGLLAQSCAEACDLLRDWLESGWFSQVRPSGDGLLAEVVPTAEQFSQFLGPIFEDALSHAAQAGVPVDTSGLQDARAKVAGLARRRSESCPGRPRVTSKAVWARRNRSTGKISRLRRASSLLR